MNWSNKTKKRVKRPSKKCKANKRTNKHKSLYRGGANKGVGNVNCNVAIKNNVLGSCLTSEIINSVKKEYNNNHPQSPINDTDKQKVLKKIIESKRCADERCVLEDINNKQEIIETRYAPEHPRSWLKNPDEWLTNEDIDKFLDDVEQKYSDFEALRTTPIDFDKRVWGQCVERELCEFSLKDKLSKGKKRFGAVFNLDKHDQPGSHWVSLFVSVDGKAIVFFDSALGGVPKEIVSFVKKIQGQAKEQGIKMVFHTNIVEHQKSNTECGMYSIYFITEMLADFKNLEKFMKGNIPDEIVFKKRSEYFNGPLNEVH